MRTTLIALVTLATGVTMTGAPARAEWDMSRRSWDRCDWGRTDARAWADPEARREEAYHEIFGDKPRSGRGRSRRRGKKSSAKGTPKAAASPSAAPPPPPEAETPAPSPSPGK